MTDEVIAVIDELGRATLDAAVIEFRDTANVSEPYVSVPLLDGPCYVWDPLFIDDILLAMATDKLDQFSEDELEVWRYFINFQNYHSTSAKTTDCNGLAVGCTIPNEFNESFVVCATLDPMDGENGRPRQLCQPPGYEVEGENIWKSLDNAMIALYNCEPIDTCNRDDDYEDIAPCSI